MYSRRIFGPMSRALALVLLSFCLRAVMSFTKTSICSINFDFHHCPCGPKILCPFLTIFMALTLLESMPGSASETSYTSVWDVFSSKIRPAFVEDSVEGKDLVFYLFACPKMYPKNYILHRTNQHQTNIEPKPPHTITDCPPSWHSPPHSEVSSLSTPPF
ncbi:hypothetical protein F4821DRAFT_154772 [Hypoxylon rubiginosum]|uniref:Uncharacterized protein n=1 Tax=Hypoxylon rubiginosum TaxID=110542 RepID=A0ACC0CXQ2_9PEZI|nr:hypothetical protein F4821DRAFT_154772 [Hypoxylon rubiginosum]